MKIVWGLLYDVINDEIKNDAQIERNELNNKNESIKFYASNSSGNTSMNNSFNLNKVDKQNKEKQVTSDRIKIINDLNSNPSSITVSKNVTPTESRQNSPA